MLDDRREGFPEEAFGLYPPQSDLEFRVAMHHHLPFEEGYPEIDFRVGADVYSWNEKPLNHYVDNGWYNDPKTL
jgi:hypothetical protein